MFSTHILLGHSILCRTFNWRTYIPYVIYWYFGTQNKIKIKIKTTLLFTGEIVIYDKLTGLSHFNQKLINIFNLRDRKLSISPRFYHISGTASPIIFQINQLKCFLFKFQTLCSVLVFVIDKLCHTLLLQLIILLW